MEDGPYVAKQIKQQLDLAKHKVIETDQDRIFLITGPEGSGKSTLAMQLAYYLNPKFSLDDIVFNSEQFAKRIRTAPKYSCIVFDEAFNGLSSKGVLSKENKKLIRLLQECRQRNLFIFIVLPSVFLLEKYVILFRAHALFHCAISKKNYKDRYYKAYNRNKIKLLFLLGHKFMSYSRPRIIQMYIFRGKLPPTVSDKAYRSKKLKSFGDSEKRDLNQNDRVMLQRDILINKVHTIYKKPYSEMTKWFDEVDAEMAPTTIVSSSARVRLLLEKKEKDKKSS